MAEDNAELGAALNRLIPKTLDTIIMLNRDCAEIRIATAGDLKPLRARIPPILHYARETEADSISSINYEAHH